MTSCPFGTSENTDPDQGEVKAGAIEKPGFPFCLANEQENELIEGEAKAGMRPKFFLEKISLRRRRRGSRSGGRGSSRRLF